MQATIEDRIRGSLLGLVWGDVLGCPVEGWRETQIWHFYKEYPGLPERYTAMDSMTPRHRRRLRPLGLHSDDTQQALSLIAVCLSPEGWRCETWAKWLTQGMRDRAWRDFGQNFASAVQKLQYGTPPGKSGSPSAGIGAAMRVAPLGAIYRDNPSTLARAVMECSAMTHADLRAGAFSYAVAWSVAAFVNGQSTEQVRDGLPGAVETVERAWITERADWTVERHAPPRISESLRRLLCETWQNPAELRQRVSEHARPFLPPHFTVAHPNQGFVLLGGMHALMMGLATKSDPEETLREIIRQGYDTDTVAAICGGILGARFGSRWIPLHRLIDRERLEHYADALVTRSGPPETPEEFMAREGDLTRLEKQFQAVL